jgi:hypothetical protein
LIFIKNSKKPEINDRVIYEKYQMSKYRLRIDKERCPNLMNEFASAEWEEKLSVKLKRKDDKDHGINSYEYFLEPEMTINYIISPNDYGEYAKDMRMKS